MKTKGMLLSSVILIYLAVSPHEVKATNPVIKMTGDGNCWFRALSYYRQSNEDDHRDLRENIALFMWQRREIYRSLIRHERDIDLFITNQRYDGVYAEGITLQGSADFLGINLYVTIHDEGRDVITYRIRPSDNQYTTENWLHVRQNGENHFDVIGCFSPNHNFGMRPDDNTILWYDGISDHDRLHTVHHDVDNMKGESKIYEEKKEEDISQEEETKPGDTVGEDDLDLIMRKLNIRIRHDVDNMKGESKIYEDKKEEDIVKQEETKEPADTVGEDELDSIMRELEIREDRPTTADKDQVTATYLDLKAKKKLKLPISQLTEIYQGAVTIQAEESEDLEFKTPPQSPVENGKKLSDLFVELDSELTESGADREDNSIGDDVNEVIESMQDEVDGKTQAELKGDNNKEDNSDNPIYIDVGSIDELRHLSGSGGLTWTHFKVYRKFGDYHHHFLVLNSEEKGLTIIHLHPKFENLKMKIICEVENISFCDNKTWRGLLDFGSGLTIVRRASYREIHSETELFKRVQEVLGHGNYSLIDEDNFYCETIVTYILTGRKISSETERYKILHPNMAMAVFYLVETLMGCYRYKYAIDVVYLMFTLLSAPHVYDQDISYHLANIISFSIRMYFYIKQRKNN